jgi:hypothetical protein
MNRRDRKVSDLRQRFGDPHARSKEQAGEEQMRSRRVSKYALYIFLSQHNRQALWR